MGGKKAQPFPPSWKRTIAERTPSTSSRSLRGAGAYEDAETHWSAKYETMSSGVQGGNLESFKRNINTDTVSNKSGSSGGSGVARHKVALVLSSSPSSATSGDETPLDDISCTSGPGREVSFQSGRPSSVRNQQAHVQGHSPFFGSEKAPAANQLPDAMFDNLEYTTRTSSGTSSKGVVSSDQKVLPDLSDALLQQTLMQKSEDTARILALTKENSNLEAKLRSFQEQHRRMLGTLDREYAESKHKHAKQRELLRKENEDVLLQMAISEKKYRKGLEQAGEGEKRERARAEEAEEGRKKAEEQRNALVRQLAKLRAELAKHESAQLTGASPAGHSAAPATTAITFTTGHESAEPARTSSPGASHVAGVIKPFNSGAPSGGRQGDKETVMTTRQRIVALTAHVQSLIGEKAAMQLKIVELMDSVEKARVRQGKEQLLQAQLDAARAEREKALHLASMLLSTKNTQRQKASLSSGTSRGMSLIPEGEAEESRPVSEGMQKVQEAAKRNRLEEIDPELGASGMLAQQQTQLHKTLDVDSIEELRREKTQLEHKCSTLEERCRAAEQLEHKCSTLEERCRAAEQALNEAHHDLGQTRRERDGLIDKSESLVARFKDTSMKLASLQESVISVSKDTSVKPASLQENDSKERESRDCSAEVGHGHEEPLKMQEGIIESLQTEKAQAHREKAAYKKEAEQLKQELLLLKEDKDALRHAMEALENERRALALEKSHSADLKKKVAELQEAAMGGADSLCVELEEHKERIRELAKSNEELQQDLRQVTDSELELAKHNEELQQDLEEHKYRISELEDKVHEEEDARQAATTRLADLEALHQSDQESLRAANARSQAASKECEALAKSNSECMERIGRLIAQCAHADEEKASIEMKAQVQIDAILVNLTDTKTELAKSQQEFAKLQGLAQQVAKSKDDFRRDLDEHKESIRDLAMSKEQLQHDFAQAASARDRIQHIFDVLCEKLGVRSDAESFEGALLALLEQKMLLEDELNTANAQLQGRRSAEGTSPATLSSAITPTAVEQSGLAGATRPSSAIISRSSSRALRPVRPQSAHKGNTHTHVRWQHDEVLASVHDNVSKDSRPGTAAAGATTERLSESSSGASSSCGGSPKNGDTYSSHVNLFEERAVHISPSADPNIKEGELHGNPLDVSSGGEDAMPDKDVAAEVGGQGEDEQIWGGAREELDVGMQVEEDVYAEESFGEDEEDEEVMLHEEERGAGGEEARGPIERSADNLVAPEQQQQSVAPERLRASVQTLALPPLRLSNLLPAPVEEHTAPQSAVGEVARDQHKGSEGAMVEDSAVIPLSRQRSGSSSLASTSPSSLVRPQAPETLPSACSRPPSSLAKMHEEQRIPVQEHEQPNELLASPRQGVTGLLVPDEQDKERVQPPTLASASPLPALPPLRMGKFEVPASDQESRSLHTDVHAGKGALPQTTRLPQEAQHQMQSPTKQLSVVGNLTYVDSESSSSASSDDGDSSRGSRSSSKDGLLLQGSSSSGSRPETPEVSPGSSWRGGKEGEEEEEEEGSMLMPLTKTSPSGRHFFGTLGMFPEEQPFEFPAVQEGGSEGSAHAATDEDNDNDEFVQDDDEECDDNSTPFEEAVDDALMHLPLSTSAHRPKPASKRLN